MDGRTPGLLARGSLCCHCLLIETAHSLALVDTGFGTRDVHHIVLTHLDFHHAAPGSPTSGGCVNIALVIRRSTSSARTIPWSSSGWRDARYRSRRRR